MSFVLNLGLYSDIQRDGIVLCPNPVGPGGIDVLWPARVIRVEEINTFSKVFAVCHSLMVSALQTNATTEAKLVCVFLFYQKNEL